MLLLNILQNSDGSLAWDNIVILLAAFLLGFLLNRFSGKQREKRIFSRSLQEWESKYKKLENEFKAHKSGLAAAEKQGERSLLEMTQRAKALEGDIRALSDEKNRYLQQLGAKTEELKSYSKQVGELEDKIKSMKESSAKAEAAWTSRLKASQEALSRASAWEGRVRAAEEEAMKARAAVHQAERRQLESELRLKSTAEYAGKVVPLENELTIARERLHAADHALNNLKLEIHQKDLSLAAALDGVSAAQDLRNKLNTLEAQMQLQRDNHSVLQKEFELKHAANLALKSELESLRQNLAMMHNQTAPAASALAGKTFMEQASPGL